MKDFSLLEKRLGIKFKDKNLLIQAFIHRSYLNEHPKFEIPHNERLEFLGDAVLELIVTEYLFNSYLRAPEGEMTNWRAALVNAKMLSQVAEKLGFNEFLLLSKGEERETGRARMFILANVFEAFIGALYLDKGLRECEIFIKENLIKYLPEIIEKRAYKDAKSKFQERAQEEFGITPTYKVLNEKGPDHAKIFEMGVYLKEELIATGKGSSKQEAEEEAAKKALETKGWN